MTEGFAAVPNWMVRDERVSLHALMVYTALASHTGPGGVHPSQATLASEARCSERQVRYAIAELQELGVVEVVRRRRKTAGATTLSNGYVMHPNGRLAEDEEPMGLPADGAGTHEGLPAHSDRATGTEQQVAPYIEEEPFKKNPVARKRGTRLDESFRVTAEMAQWARANAPLVNGPRSTEQFRNYWVSKTGANATKLDWVKTWKNWLLKDQTDAERRGGRAATPTDRARATLALGADDQLEIPA